eukprot:scaffold4026_cov117-Cylindrotheca_fusiformis.AAC.30
MSSEVQSTSSSGIGATILNGVVTLTFRIGTLVAGLSTLVAVLLYFKQDSMLYFPEISGLARRPADNPERYRSPEEHQVPFEDLYIECEDGVSIHAWLLTRTKEKNNLPTLVFFHGNAGNIGLRIPNALHMLQHLNANVMMVEYRGYGHSDSVKPNEKGLKLDAQAALKFISKHPKVDSSKIFLFGRSLGGAVAFDLAQYAENNQLPIAGVIAENTFLSISTMVDQLMPMIAPLKGLVLRIGWDSSKIVPNLNAPILYLAGKRDELVPHSHMKELFRLSTKSRLPRFHIIERGTHNESWLKGGQAYWDAIKMFMSEALNSTPQRMGTAETLSSRQKTDSASSSIPIMPGGLMGIAKEKLREKTSTDGLGGKKEL